MRRKLKITVSRQPTGTGVVACKRVLVRERLIKLLLGSPVKLTVVVPGDDVDEVAIKEAETEDKDEVV